MPLPRTARRKRTTTGNLPTRVLLALVACTVALGAHGGEFYDDALERYRDRDFRGALIQLRNELQQQPDSLSARVLLGRVYMALGDHFSAREQLRRARQGGADPALVVPLIASTYFAERNYAGFLGDYPAARFGEEVAAVQASRAEALLRLNRPEEAEQAIAEAARRQPNNVDLQLGHARVLVRLGRVEEAERVVDRALRLDPDDANAWYVKGELRSRGGDLEGARPYYLGALEIDPQHLGARVARVVGALQLGQLEEARRARAEIDERFASHPQTLFMDSQLRLAEGDREGSRAALQQARVEFDAIPPETVETDTFLLWLGGNIHYQLGSWETAQRHLSRHVRLMPHELRTRIMLAEVQVQNGDWQGALETLQALPSSALAEPRVQATLGYAHLGAGHTDEALQALRSAADALPDSAELRMAVGSAERATGDPEAARKTLREALNMAPGLLEATWELAHLELEAGEGAAALELAEEAVDRYPADSRAHTLMADALTATGDTRGAIESLRRALRLEPDSIQAKSRLARSLAATDDIGGAITEYESILAASPADVDALAALARLAERQGDLPAAVRWLERLREQVGIGDPRIPRLVELYLQLDRGDAALELATALDRNRPVSPPLMMLLGRVLIHEGELSRARALLDTPYGLLLDSPRELFELARLQLAADALDDARRSLDRVLELEPESLAAQAAYVTLDIRDGKLEEALGRALRMRETNGDRALGHVALARVYAASGRFAEAAGSYEEALSLEPSWTLARRLFQARVSAGRLEEAQRGLSEWVSAHPDEGEARRLLATRYLQAGNMPEARRQHEALLRLSPDDADVLNNLAWITWSLGDPAALGHAREAFRLAPGNHFVLDTLGWILVTDGQVSEGLRYLREAHVRAADAPGIRYHLAVALTELGQVEEARRHLQHALRMGGAFGERAAADALLRSLDGESPAS